MKKNRIILILLFFAFCLSCNTNHEISFDKKLIKSISDENKYLPSRFFNLFFFCKCQNEEISILSVYELREVYHNGFKNMYYKDFLTELFNQKLKVDCTLLNNKFKINADVQKNFLKMTLVDFINFYCVKKRENIFWLKNDIAEESKKSILYFLFLNNYITNIDDYNGSFVIMKVS